MKRALKLGIIALLLLIVAGVSIFYIAGRSGSSAVEGWIGQQFQDIANAYLNPKLSFNDLDYQFPGTVKLKNLRLTAEDPANPGQTIDIIGCESATVTLAEIPAIGKPIVIEKIILQKPLFSAVSIEPKSHRLIGFSQMMRRGLSDTQPATEPSGKSRPKLTDVFRIRLIQIDDGRIVYDPRIAGTRPMELDQINTALDVQADESGWYKLSTKISREPIFTMSVAGQLNLDNFAVRDAALKLNADLQPKHLSYLPPELQSFLKKYEVDGQLAVTVIGDVPLMHPEKGDVEADLKLSQANVTLGDYRIPVDNLEASARIDDGKLIVPNLKIAGLRGTTQGGMSAELTGAMPGSGSLTMSGMMLEDLVAARNSAEPSHLAGRLDGSLTFDAPLRIVEAKMRRDPTGDPFATQTLPDNWGSGTLSVTDGRLIKLPVLHYLIDAIETAGKIVPLPISSGGKPTETASVNFNMSQSQVNINEFIYAGDVVGARGNGRVMLDQTLDLLMSGGPVQTMKNLLGDQIGGALATVSDKLLAYHVTGTVHDPQVNLQIAGGSVGTVGRGVKNGAESIGEGIGEGINKIGQGIGNILKPKDGQ